MRVKLISECGLASSGAWTCGCLALTRRARALLFDVHGPKGSGILLDWLQVCLRASHSGLGVQLEQVSELEGGSRKTG